MAAIKLEHTDLAEHQVSVTQHLRKLWMKGDLCDVTIKSKDGTEHCAHANVLSAASEFFNRLLVGTFQEADRLRKKSGEPLQIEASANVLSALLDYIYGGQPEVLVSDSIELFRLAHLYGCSKLVATIDTGLQSFLDKPQADPAIALRVLLEFQWLHDLKAACEAAVAKNFAACVQDPNFLKLDACQLGRIVERSDLNIRYEEEVLEGIFKWFNHSSADRCANLGLLLRHVDFQSISLGNMARIRYFASSMGCGGDYLQREVDDALQARKKRRATASPDGFQPKRQCFQHWSPELGAISHESWRNVYHRKGKTKALLLSFCWHEGAIYASDRSRGRVVFWKPGFRHQVIAGEGATVVGVNNLGRRCELCVSPDGKIFVADIVNDRLVSFKNGSGHLVLGDVEGIRDVSCSPNGVVYVLSQGGRALHKLVDTTLQPVIVSDDFPEQRRFFADRLFVASEDVVYFSDGLNSRVLRITPGETEPMVVCQVPMESLPTGLFVTEDRTVYFADESERKVWAFHPSDRRCSEVLKCPEDWKPHAVVVQNRSLYVSMSKPKGSSSQKGTIREYFLPPELQLG